MPTDAKAFIDFWVQNCVHAGAHEGQGGGSQNAKSLAWRLIVAAEDQNFSLEDIGREIGDPTEYIEAKLIEMNAAENYRRGRR